MGKTKLWKNNGKEDKFIERLIREGSFTNHTKPLTLKRNYPKMFEDFSNNVIRNHINEIKRRNGLYLSGPDGVSEEEDDEEENTAPADNGLNDNLSIAEPGTSNASVSSAVQANHQNYPTIVETYIDPETFMDMVLVAVSVPGGAQKIKVEVNSDGTSITIKYNWGKAMYDLNDLFKNVVAAREMTMSHPKVVAMKRGLEKCRSRIDAAPEASISINLPIQVQTAPEMCKKTGFVRDDGLQVVMVELVGFVKDYHKKNSDCAMVFDK